MPSKRLTLDSRNPSRSPIHRQRDGRSRLATTLRQSDRCRCRSRHQRAACTLGARHDLLSHPINDGDGNSNAIITTAVRCVVTLIENDIRTLVTCSAGMSRSPAIAAAAIAIVVGHSPDGCLTAITTDAPHDVSPPLWAQVKSVYNEIVGN